MEDITMRYIHVYYNKSFKIDKKDPKNIIKVSIEYLSKDEYDIYYCSDIRGEIIEYMENEYDCKKNDIIDIINNIREITKGIKEKKLIVSVDYNNTKKNCEGDDIVYNEWASYENGYFASAGAYESFWDDEIGVGAGSQGITIRFYKSHFDLNYERMDYVKERLKPFYEKVMTLCNMTNEEEKYKKTEQEKVYQRKFK